MTDQRHDEPEPGEQGERDEEPPRGIGGDAESPGRSLIKDGDEIVEPNEPA